MVGFRVGRRRDGVITAATPRMTAENPADSKPRSAERPVEVNGLQEIARTGGRVAAAGGRTGGELEQRAEDPLIETDHHADDGTEESRDHG